MYGGASVAGFNLHQSLRANGFQSFMIVNNKISKKHYDTEVLLIYDMQYTSLFKKINNLLNNFIKTHNEKYKINYFEFWEAFEDRLNSRECYKKESDSWRKFFLQS